MWSHVLGFHCGGVAVVPLRRRGGGDQGHGWLPSWAPHLLGRAAQAVRGCVSVAQDDQFGVGRVRRLADYARGLLLLLVVLGGRGDRVPRVFRRVIATLRVGFGSVVGLGGARGAREHRGGRSREA